VRGRTTEIGGRKIDVDRKIHAFCREKKTRQRKIRATKTLKFFGDAI